MATDVAPQAFGTWWIGDAVGVVLVAPVVVTWQRGFPRTWRYGDFARAPLVLAAAVVVASVVFGVIDAPPLVKMAMIILAPLVLWAALNLGRRVS